MVKTVQDLKTEFNTEIDILKKTHTEMRIELTTSVTQRENSGERLKRNSNR